MVTIDLTLGERLKQLRKSSLLTLDDVKNSTGISKSSLIKWEKNERIPNKYNLEKLSKIYKIDIAELYQLIQLMGIPVFNKAQIGKLQYDALTNKNLIMFDEAIFQLTDIKDYFFTKKEDDSLENIGITVGSLILCRITNSVPNNKIGIFINHKEAMMREIEYINDNEAFLISHSNNKRFKKIKINLQDITTIAQVEKVILDFK